VIDALAGTGKTSTAVSCLSQSLSGRVGFVAFNQHIAQELRSRLPPSVPAYTLHALGFSAVKRALPQSVLDAGKLMKLANELAPSARPSERQAAEQLARLCKYTLTPEDSDTELDTLVGHYGIEVDDPVKTYALARRLVQRSASDAATLDFDDMVWWPVRMKLPIDQFDLLVVDEAQDLSRVQQTLAQRATTAGRLVPIGDKNQAIYGFSGADCDSLPRLTSLLEETEGRGCRVLPLTVTWRCPVSHVELARRIVPAIEPAPGVAEGEVRTMTAKEIAAAVRPGDLVVGRRNAPLVGMTYRLVLAGVKAVMRGRDIGRGLTSLIRRLKPADLKDLIDRLADYREREERRLSRKGDCETHLEALEDRCETLGQLASQVDSLDDLDRFIETTFDDTEKPGASVVLSSIHRAKGLEANTVFVLDTKSLPLARRKQKPWEAQQERNLCYIAVTRAKKVLTFQDQAPSIFTR
jgi:DNA helicase-2/ATP-dependent DNA helicase PcrA